MLAKTACIAVQTLVTYLAMKPPKAPAKKESTDKVKKDPLFVAIYVGFISPPGQAIVISLSTIYLALVYHGTIPAHLRPWQTATCVLSVFALALRYWAYKTLDRFFTLQLRIREGHRLIGTGPYRYLLHPSYTGLVVVMVSYVVTLSYEGYWRYVIAPVLPVPIAGAMVTLALLWYQMAVAIRRAQDEEAMLAQEFGQQWTDHAATRWRFVPFIY
ncbi:hypothetical protein CPB97_011759 [Podila verticillata]|nr:hypothetical protein CPB97_011759 [Podila verticillata]